MPVIATCPTCNDKFVRTANRQKYCKPCGRRPSGDCSVCGKHFIHSGNSTGKYCSRECFWNSARSPERMPRPCVTCGTVFKPKTPDAKACSRECSGAAQRRSTKPCPVCGKDFNSRHRSKTCSYECAGVQRRAEKPNNCRRCGVLIPWAGTRQKSFCSAECRRTPDGTTRLTPQGYIEERTDNGWRLQHRVIMERKLGRPMLQVENVHHINGVRTDNREENLELWVRSQPSGIRAEDFHCACCRFKE